MKFFKSLPKLLKELNINNIPCTDFDAWYKYNKYHKIYNKLFIAESQDIESGPMGILPKKYPVIFKPIINLFGMSRGFSIIRNKEEYFEKLQDGLFWMEYLDGEQYNLDLILLNGEIKYYTCLKSKPYTEGTFEYHESLPNYTINNVIKDWIIKYFNKYTGCLNLEFINNKIIEAHLRLNGDYYLYDIDFTKELDNLYNNNKWNYYKKINKKYIIPVFCLEKINIEIEIIIDILKNYKCTNLYIDNFNSSNQRGNIKRLFMFECKDLKDGLNAKDDILDFYVK